jgi:DUF1365 family protein
VIEFCAENGIGQAVQKVRLLTNVRFWGYVFNPVSFFFCFDKEQKPLCCVAEIGNTFGEKKLYFIAAQGECFQTRQTKLFYISPFTELNQDLVFDLALPSKSLSLKIQTYDGVQPVVTTYLRGQRALISDWNLLVLTLRYPFAPMRVIALIHLHALLLWLKRVPHHRKEENRDQQIAVLNPHPSLQKPEGSNHVNAS